MKVTSTGKVENKDPRTGPRGMEQDLESPHSLGTACPCGWGTPHHGPTLDGPAPTMGPLLLGVFMPGQTGLELEVTATPGSLQAPEEFFSLGDPVEVSRI